MTRLIARGSGTLFVSIALVACKASVKGDIHTGAEMEAGEPETSSPAALASSSPTTATSAAAAETSFVGVTHGLTLSPQAAAKERCSCLAVAVGAPSDPAFVWQGKPPTVGPEAVVLALDAAPCRAGKSGRGPSIQGVEKEGENVVVSLEEPGAGVPLARGAIIVRPAAPGTIVLRAPTHLPYAKTSCTLRLAGP